MQEKCRWYIPQLLTMQETLDKVDAISYLMSELECQHDAGV